MRSLQAFIQLSNRMTAMPGTLNTFVVVDA